MFAFGTDARGADVGLQYSVRKTTFYCGQLRLWFDERCFPPKKINGQNPVHLIGGYAAELGAKINPAVMSEPQIFSKALARVARWRPRVPSGYQPGYDFEQPLTEEAAQAASAR